MNVDVAAIVCKDCGGNRVNLGAPQGRLALWCLACEASIDVSFRKCRPSSEKNRELRCSFCHPTGVDMLPALKCAGKAGGSIVHLCVGCVALTRGEQRVQCTSCWHAEGELCVHCLSRRGQQHLDKYRSCKECIRVKFCKRCMLPPENNKVVRTCQMCPNKAMWCCLHHIPEQIQMGMCSYHYKNFLDLCQYCRKKKLEYRSFESGVVSVQLFEFFTSRPCMSAVCKSVPKSIVSFAVLVGGILLACA